MSQQLQTDELTAEGQTVDPNIQIIADNLPALMAIRQACHDLGWRCEYLLCAALLLTMATVVEGETPGHSDAHQSVLQMTDEIEWTIP